MTQRHLNGFDFQQFNDLDTLAGVLTLICFCMEDLIMKALQFQQTQSSGLIHFKLLKQIPFWSIKLKLQLDQFRMFHQAIVNHPHQEDQLHQMNQDLQILEEELSWSILSLLIKEWMDNKMIWKIYSTCFLTTY